MAKKKAVPARPAPSPKVSVHAAEKSGSAADYDPNEQRRVLDELQARHGRVEDPHRAAFDSLSTNARRADLGGRTRAPGVLREGIGWAVQIDQACPGP